MGECTSLVIVSDTSATCVTPAHADGFADVVAVSIIDEEGALPDGFEFVPPWYIDLSISKPGFHVQASITEDISSDSLITTTDTNWTGGYSLTVEQNTSSSDLICRTNNSYVLPSTTIDNSSTLDANSYGIGKGTNTDLPTNWRVVSDALNPSTISTSSTNGIFNDYVYLGVNIDALQPICNKYEGSLLFTAIYNP